QRQKLNRAIRTYGPDSGGPDGGAAVSWRGDGIRVLVVAALRTASSLALAGAVMTDCAGGCPVAATTSASRARSSCARARRARARLGQRARAWRYCWRASSTWPVAASKKPRLAWPIASPTILAEHRQRLIGSAGSGQRQSQVGLELDVLRREPRAGFEGSFSIGPPPLKIVAVAGVIPDLGIPRAEPKRLVVVHLRLGETAQPVKCVADPTMRQRLIG